MRNFMKLLANKCVSMQDVCVCVCVCVCISKNGVLAASCLPLTGSH